MDPVLATLVFLIVTFALHLAGFTLLTPRLTGSESGLTLSTLASIGTVGVIGFTMPLVGTGQELWTYLALAVLVFLVNSAAVAMLFRSNYFRAMLLYFTVLGASVLAVWLLSLALPEIELPEPEADQAEQTSLHLGDRQTASTLHSGQFIKGFLSANDLGLTGSGHKSDRSFPRSSGVSETALRPPVVLEESLGSKVYFYYYRVEMWKSPLGPLNDWAEPLRNSLTNIPGSGGSGGAVKPRPHINGGLWSSAG